MGGPKTVTAAVLILAALAAACSAGGGDSGGGHSDGGATAGRVTELRGSGQAEALGAADAGGDSGAPALRLPSLGAAVIKTAGVHIGVKDGVDAAVQEATAVAGRFGGFVASTSLTGGDDPRATVVLRVPAESFERALQALQDLGEVERHSVSGEDVSQQLVDLEARLRNWRSQEAVLLRLMDRSRSVSDTIRVQGELSRVQLEIERLRGRLGYLEDQTSYGTITATFSPAGAAPNRPSRLAKALEQAVRAALSVVSALIVGLGFALPVALLAGIVVLVVRGLRPRLTP